MRIPAAILALSVVAAPLAAQEHQHAGEKLGTVHFQTSCAPAAGVEFDRAIALLHSFEFGQAIRGFNGVLAADSSCAMARWGIALARWGNPMVPNLRAAAQLNQGRQDARAAAAIESRATPREQAYIGAVAKLYDNFENTTQQARVVAYEQAMGSVATQYIGDTEASIFYAISLVASAPPTDKTYANQLRAGAMLEAMWAKQPEHPGLAHYIIHAYDVPALAPQARVAAQRYADIAPSAAHALHMPSHTFTRVGMWNESVVTNLKSMEAATRDSSIGERLHAMDYAVYAYLQMRKDAEAKKLMDQIPSLVPQYDVNAIRGAATGAAGMFAVAAIPARYAIERREWQEAAAINPRASTFLHTDAISWFARALGAAHTGDREKARAAIDTLKSLSDRLKAAGEAYWAEQVAIQTLEARAALYVSEGAQAAALEAMGEAARREDATEKSAVTPGPIVPAHELLGDMYSEMRKHRDAMAHYQESMKKEPGRFRSLYGAMKAAQNIGDKKLQGEYASQIEKITGVERLDQVAESWRTRLWRWGFNFFPAYRGTGGRVTYIAGDWTEIRVTVPLNWRTRNYVKTIFGGSIYGAVDPFYMFMLIKLLGPEYVVWDKTAAIRFRRPGRERLFAKFVVTPADLDEIRNGVAAAGKYEKTYTVNLASRSGEVHAIIEKGIHISKRS